jgi:hypothetical protein
MTLPCSIRQIQTLVMAYHPLIVVETVEEDRVQTLLKQATQEMQTSLYEWSVTQGLVRSPGTYDAPWINECAPPGANKPVPIENTTEPGGLLNHLHDTGQKAIYLLKDFAPHLDDLVLARHFREVLQLFAQTRSAIILTGDAITLPREIAHTAVFYDLPLPGRDELYQVVSEVVRNLKAKNRIQVSIQKHEVPILVQALMGMTLKQAKQVVAYAALEDGEISINDVTKILHRKSQVIKEDGLLDYLPVEENSAELGGFEGLKAWLQRAKVGFSPQAKQFNLKPPKGVLIVGIQGCGKSLAAKAIAREWRMPLLKLDAGKLYDKYIGESEKNFHRAIKLAESMAPTVLWIDEIEKSLGVSSGDSDGGLSRRLFGSFLTWLQEKSQDVFVVATANNLSQIPPELLRKGRFDEIFFVDLPDDTERDTILNIHLNRRNQDTAQLDMSALVRATDGFSGAEIEQAVIAGLYRSLYLKTSLNTDLLIQEIKSTVPLSVSRREDLEELRAIAQERFVSAK